MANVWKRDRVNARGLMRSTVVFRHPVTGEQITHGTYPKKIADEWVRRLQVTIDDPGFVDPRLGREPFKTYAEKWFQARGLQPSTKKVRSYLDSQLLPAFGEVQLSTITRFTVQDWVDGLVEPADDGRSYSAESIRSYYNTLSTIMKMAAVDGHIHTSPVGRGLVTLPNTATDTRVFLNLDELDDLLVLVGRELPYWYPMIKLVAETGMRWGEVAGLELDALDLVRCSVLIEQSLALDPSGAWHIGRPKGGRSRKLGIDGGTSGALESHLQDHPATPVTFNRRAHRLVFTNADGRALDRNNFRRDVWKPFIDTVTWLPDGLRFHDLRHTHISILLDLGTPVGDVADRAGHASAKMTMDRYRHRMPHADSRALDRVAAARAERTTEQRKVGLRVVRG